ncbi:hypothetical protein ACNQGB_17650 [Flavobacterium sp. XS1P32]|uniref:hypothetical protein n=1 Tax=unclassified Flavobacterium TaxID=196869 RepID=UPI003AAE2F92
MGTAYFITFVKSSFLITSIYYDTYIVEKENNDFVNVQVNDGILANFNNNSELLLRKLVPNSDAKIETIVNKLIDLKNTIIAKHPELSSMHTDKLKEIFEAACVENTLLKNCLDVMKNCFITVGISITAITVWTGLMCAVSTGAQQNAYISVNADDTTTPPTAGSSTYRNRLIVCVLTQFSSLGITTYRSTVAGLACVSSFGICMGIEEIFAQGKSAQLVEDAKNLRYRF